jgi:hypothetical protein
MTLNDALFNGIQESSKRGTITLCLAALLGSVMIAKDERPAGMVNLRLGDETSWVTDEILFDAREMRSRMDRALKNKLN